MLSLVMMTTDDGDGRKPTIVARTMKGTSNIMNSEI
jgi:hypothetical protein